MKSMSRLAIPYIIWGALMIFLPMLLIVIYSITKEGNGILSIAFTFEHYKKFFTDPDFLVILFRSLVIAVKTTILCLIIGYPIGYYISRSKPSIQNTLVLLVTVPMWINMLVRTYAWIGILSDGGLAQQSLKLLGFDPSTLLYTEGAVILGMVYNFLPFMVLQINSALAKMDNSLLEASADLGADNKMTFMKVTLPLSVPGILSGISLVFLPCVSSFFIPKMLGGGKYMMIGNVIENQFINVGEWAFGSTIAVIIALVMMISMYAVRNLEKRQSY
ncbi:MAG: ABC transporter permease [Eubacteriales bacterium]|nr:ABC transporter permease [Eubacteriales bacterium]MDY3332712.1 ABC transporter permease [Gallibacter sp.]